jgi:DNA mismatch repair protein MutL
VRHLRAFDATYLLAEVQGEREPELWIVDQHVAHERILYERLFLRHRRPAVQPLLPPQVVRVPEALARLGPFLADFVQAGLEVEPFGEDALVVRGLPDFLMERDPPGPDRGPPGPGGHPGQAGPGLLPPGDQCRTVLQGRH